MYTHSLGSAYSSNMGCETQIFNYISYPTCNVPVSSNCLPPPFQTRDIMKDITYVPKNSTFSIFNKKHAIESAKVIDTLITTENITDFLMTALLFRDKLPQVMFYYALSSAMIHHKSFKGAWVPHPYYVMPDHFFTDRSLFKIGADARERQKRVMDNNDPTSNNEIQDSKESSNDFTDTTTSLPSLLILDDLKNNTNEENKKNDMRTIRTIKRDETGSNEDPEHNLWYFREDITVNSFHWHWHTIYPAQWVQREGKPIKNRKGELFFHMHRQIIRRYNAERFAFNMSSVKPLDDWKTVIPEGYFPHLYSNADDVEYPARPGNMIFQDINVHGGIYLKVENLTEWTRLIKKAIKDGFAQKSNSNETIPLNNANGTDILAAMIESSSLSPDDDIYGTLHNGGHVIISQIHDPLGKYNTPPSVMGYTETSMRDPIFYRWHKFIDNLFQEHKDNLSPYTEEELEWKKIRIKDAIVINEERSIKNELCTYYESRVLDVTKGLDFSLAKGSVLVKVDHLNHDPFTYVIKVRNPTKRDLNANVRIYLAPKNNEEREEANDSELYKQFFEMDVFKVKIRPGLRIITRSSKKSTVSLEPLRTWMNLEADPAKSNFSTEYQTVCNCGWPDHLLVPRGTKEGMPFYMLVYITNYDEDKVDNSQVNTTLATSYHCIDGVRMCGVVGELFPDKRPMGFPFDRKIPINKRHPYSRQFFEKCNMFLTEIKIYHLGEKADLEEKLKDSSSTKSNTDEADIEFS